MEELLENIAYRLRDYYFDGLAIQRTAFDDDEKGCIVDISNEQVLNYIKDNMPKSTYCICSCKWNTIHKLAYLYIDGHIDMVSAKWRDGYSWSYGKDPIIREPSDNDWSLGDISSYDGFHDLLITPNEDGSEFDITIVVYEEDTLHRSKINIERSRREKCRFMLHSKYDGCNNFIYDILRRGVCNAIYRDTIKNTKERIIEKIMFGTFINELAANPYCSINSNAIKR